MKPILYTLYALLITITGFAQAYEGTIEYDKKKQQAFVIEYPYSADAVEAAIMQKMEKLGYKAKEEKGLFNKDKGFKVYKGAYVTEITDKSMDYMIKVESKGRKDKDASVLYMVINKDGENAVTSFDSYGMSNAKSFLNNLLPDVEASNLELQIKTQEDLVAKAQKKLKGLQGDKEDMEKKIRKLEDDIKDNIKDQENTQKDIDSQQQALETLKGRRKI